MKSLDDWFADYSVSHQNETNKSIHYVCVPLIYFSVIGLLMSIPAGFLKNIFVAELPVIENWAVVAGLLVFIFYMWLSVRVGLTMLLFTSICIAVNYYISTFMPLWIFSLIVFAAAWIGQFYGHKIEGKKPSFLKDLQFLLIGPAWVAEQVFK